ncbi:MAG: hypothetical protein RLZZ627_80 [Pseudomonadota bacterium]|jgi:hypothetical protein
MSLTLSSLDSCRHVAYMGAIVASLALSGCTTLAEKAQKTEQTLAASGFQVKLGSTPEQLAHIQTQTQMQLVPHEKDGNVYYVYADAQNCRCLYWGNEQAYQRYQQFALEKEIADEQRQAAAMQQSASMNWGMWGAGPWMYY